MKLRTLAIAVAMASVPFAAQADVKISGDVGVQYLQNADGTDSFKDFGSEFSLDASETIGGITYYGHGNIDYGNGGTATGDDLRVGVKGGFGEVIVGDTDNGCDATDIGGTNEITLTHTQGGCKGSDNHNITYKRSIGNFAAAASHNPDADYSALGVKGKVGPLGVSLGYETDVTANAATSGTEEVPDSCPAGEGLVNVSGGTAFCLKSDGTIGGPLITGNPAVAGAPAELENNVVLGLTGSIGPVTVGFRANALSGWDATHGINFLYSKNGHNVYGGATTGTAVDGAAKPKSLGYKRVIGNTDFFIEALDTDVAGDDTRFAIGTRHRF